MTTCDQCLDVTLNGFGGRAADDNPDFDITEVGSLGQICRADQSPKAIDDAFGSGKGGDYRLTGIRASAGLAARARVD